MKLDSNFYHTRSKLDISQFYTIGRKNIDGNTRDGLSKDFAISNNNSNIYKNVSEIIEISSHDEFFRPGFIELSLFDPRDINAERFFSLLIGRNKGMLRKYKTQMGCNIKNDITLLPNTVFYNTPFYFAKENSTEKFFEPLSTQKFKSKLISFNSDADVDDKGIFKKPNSLEAKNKITKNVIDFFRRIQDPLVYGEANANSEALFNNVKNDESYELNTFIIIPLYRPAAADIETEKIHRGGALMLFGNSHNNFNYYNFILTIQNLLLKQIFHISHSEFSLQNAHTNLELDLEHHLKTTVSKLSNGLDPYKGFPNYQILLDEQKIKLTNVKRGFDSLINNCKTVLDAYKNFKSDANRKLYPISELIKAYNQFVKEAEMYFPEIKARKKSENQNYKAKVTLPPEIFKLILFQLTFNAQKNSFDTNPEVNIKIFKTGNLLNILFSDNGPGFDEAIIHKIGVEPINNASSAGMGLYLLNKTLFYLHAEKNNRSDNENVYFKAQNKISPKSGALVLIKFKMIENEV